MIEITAIDNEIQRRQNLLKERASTRGALIRADEQTKIGIPEELISSHELAKIKAIGGTGKAKEHPLMRMFLDTGKDEIQAYVSQRLAEQLSELYKERDGHSARLENDIRAKEEEILRLGIFKREMMPRESINDFGLQEDDLPEWLKVLINLFRKKGALNGFTGI